MSIYVLEDQLFQLNTLRDEIWRQLQELGKTSEKVFTFQNVTDFIAEVQNDSSMSLYFIDIQIGENSLAGFEAARIIRKLDHDGIIVFVTTHFELAFESYQYDVSAMGFVEKKSDVSEYANQIQKFLKKYLIELPSRKWKDDLVHFPSRTGEFVVNFQDIVYFSTVGDHSIILVKKYGSQRVHSTMCELAEAEPRLWRVQRSYLINRQYVKSYSLSPPRLIMCDNELISVARKEIKNFRKWYR